MTDSNVRISPAALKVLTATMAIFAFVGYGSAFALILSPSGKAIGLSLDLLDNAPIGDFLLVGLYFLAFFGVLPTIAAYGLVTRKRWHWTDFLNRWTGQHWAWTASVASGILLLVFIVIEVALLGVLTGIGVVLQVVMSAVGIWILALVTLPSVRQSLKLSR